MPANKGEHPGKKRTERAQKIHRRRHKEKTLNPETAARHQKDIAAGELVRYDRPTDPVGDDEWESIQ